MTAERSGERDERLSPVDLRVEYARDPITVDVPVPRFSWSLEGAGRSREQSAYRIVVASTRERLAAEDGDVWDSGEVASSRSTNVAFGGEPLASRERCYWKVRVWDGDGTPSAWSDPARWEMALLSESDWEAEWIGPPEHSERIPGETWTDYAVEATFEIKNRAVGFVFRARDPENCYVWEVSLTDGESPPALRPHVRTDGDWQLLDEIPLQEFSFGSDHDRHRIRIAVEGTEITTTIDGREVDVRRDSTHDRGTIGFRAARGCRAVVDDVRVYGTGGDELYGWDFSHPHVQEFTAGTISEGRFDLRGEGFALRRHPVVSNPLLRTEFPLEGDVSEARLYVSGLGSYELSLNGERVGDRVLDPARTDYAESVLYATFDVTDRLTAGRNAIGVSLGRGRYGEPEPRVWAPPDGKGTVDRPTRGEIDWWSDPELRLQLEIEFADGTERTIASDETWKTADGPTLYNSLLTFKETYDARLEQDGWTAPGFDDSDWRDAAIVDGPDGTMVSQHLQPIRIVDEVRPVGVTEPRPGTYVFDLGKMIAGWVELAVDGERGTEVTISEGEQLSDDGTIEEIYYGGRRYHEQRYVLDGTGEETWEPRFSYGGFRYVQIDGYPGTPTLDDVTGTVVHSAVDDGNESRFDSSNELLNRIHVGARRAMLNNLYGIHHGTPTWEKLGWMETKIELGESTIYNFSMARFWTKFLRDCRDAQTESGDVRYVVPSPEPYSMWIGDHNDPGWDAGYPVVAWLVYWYYGDERVLEEHYDNLVEYVRYVERRSDDLVVRTGLGDYKQPGFRFPPEGPAIVSTAHFLQAVRIVADAADVLGRDEDGVEFRRLARDVEDAFNEEFFDPDTETYRTGAVESYRQTSNAYALAFDLVPEGHEDAVAANLAENVLEEHDGHLDVGAHGLRYLLPALTESGHHDVAYTILTRTTYPSFGYWIENGITAQLEAWKLDARSRVHDFLASVEQWFYEYLAGIRKPATPGFEHVVIAPEPAGDLERAEGVVETVRGTIASRWERTTAEDGSGDEFRLAVTIPENASGTVRVPTGDAETVRLREGEDLLWDAGDPVEQVPPGVRRVSRHESAIAVEVGSGSYRFTLTE